MRKELHHRESKWLRSEGGDDHKQMRSEYLELRLIYSEDSEKGKEVIPKEDAGQARTRTEMPEEVLEINEEVVRRKTMYVISWKFMTKMAMLRQVKRQ